MEVQLNCVICGKPFTVNGSRVAKAKFCSRECKGKGEWSKAKKEKMVSRSHSDKAREKRSKSLKLAYAEGRRKPPIPKGGKRLYYSPGTKGKHHSEKTKAKMCETWDRKLAEGYKHKNPTPKGSWEERFGPEKALQMRLKLSKSLKGKIAGDKHPNWKGGTTPLRQREVKRRYKDVFYQIERLEAFKRDNYVCQDCGKKPEKPIAHHIIPYRISKDHSSQNLLTACWKCHAKHDSQFRKDHPELFIL